MTRLLSGLVMGAAVLAAILWLPLLPLRLLVCAVAALGADEYLRIVGARRRGAQTLIIALVMVTAWWLSVVAPVQPAVLVGVTIGWLALAVLHDGRSVQDAAADLAALGYIGVPFGMLAAVHVVFGAPATLLLLGTVVVSDSAQYYTGRAFGRRPLAPTVSPKKTVEGALGGVVFGILFLMIAGAFAIPSLSLPARAVLGALLVTGGIIGDLFESKLKRMAGVKDSSTLIPGHGGVLDRVDALLFATPIFYVALLRTMA